MAATATRSAPDVRGEDQPVAVPAQYNGFSPNGSVHRVQLALLSSETANREHAVEAVERLLPTRPGVQQHLAVALGDEPVPEPSQLLAQLTVVADLAVEGEVQRAEVQRLHRTARRGR